MQILKKSLYAAIAVATLSISSLSFAQVQFTDVSFADAQKQAAKEKKLIMVDYFTDWCKWCHVLDQRTYIDREVGKFANEHFVNLKINAEKGEGIALAKKNGVQGYPTIAFYDAKGKEIDRVVGFQDAEKFLRSLMAAKEGGITSILTKLQNAEANNAMLWLQAANYQAEKGDVVKANESYDKVIALDKTEDKAYKAEATYGKAFIMQPGAEQITMLKAALEAYPKRSEAAQATRIVVLADLDSNPDAAVERAEKWAITHQDDYDFFNEFAWEAATRNVVLGKAEEFANRAIDARGTTPQDRANALDTKAEIMFRSGRPDFATVYSKQAIGMLDATKDKKQLKVLNENFEKYNKALAAMPESERRELVPAKLLNAADH
jgi:thioredoxin-related protein